MRVIKLQPQELDGIVRRITVKCCVEKLGDICGNVNPEGASPESQLHCLQVYLKAHVHM